MKRMLQNGLIFLSTFMLIIMPFLSSGNIIFAQEKDENRLELYRVVQSFEITEGISINENTLLFGKPLSDDGLVLVQHQLHEESISSELLEVVIDDTEEPMIINEIDFYIEEFESGSIFYSNDSNSEERIVLESDAELLRTNEDTVVLGNRLFLMENEEGLLGTDENSDDELDIDSGNLNPSNTKTQEKVDPDEEINISSDEVELEEEIQETSSIEEIEDLEDIQDATSNRKSFDVFNQTISEKSKSTQTTLSTKNPFFEVTVSKAPVYDNRSGKLEVVGYLEKGKVYERYNSSKNWHQIEFGDFRAYVRKSHTIPSSSNKINNKNNGSYASTKQYIRAKKDTTIYDNSSGRLIPIATISKGQSYPIALDYGGKWLYVLIADQVGFIEKNTVELLYFPNDIKYFEVAVDNAPVYDNRSGKLLKVGELKKGQVYERFNSSKNWHQILYGDYRAYVRISETIPGEANKIKNQNAGKYKNQKYKVKAKRNTTIYDNSSGSLVPIGVISKGEEYPVALDYGGKWIYVLIADQVGFINKNDVEKVYFSGTESFFKPLVHKLPIYNSTGKRKVQIGFLEKDHAYERLKSSTSQWHHLKFGNTTGYVSSDLTIPNDGKSINNKNDGEYNNQKQTFTTKIDTPVYDNTSGKLVQIGVIKKGQKYPVALDYGGKWLYVLFADQIGFVERNIVSYGNTTYSQYDLSLNEAVNIQMAAKPQTDNNYAYISKGFVKNNKVTASALNVRTGPSTDYGSIGTLKKGTVVTILEEVKGWYRIQYTSRNWVLASQTDLQYYLNPKNFINDERSQFQFLDLSKSTNVSAAKLNENLKGKGVLAGQGQAFLDASVLHGVNDLYLISHAFLETGNGTSQLAKGVMVNGVKVYNMFGIGAYDHCAVECGAQKAYEEGWTTPYKAIVGGAQFIGNSYIKQGQNTLYKMRWDPLFMSQKGRFGKQYATDIGWSVKQVGTVYNLYRDFGITSLTLDIPLYR